MGLINETNAQYYSGQQAFPALSSATDPTFNCTFNTNVVSAYNSTGIQIASAIQTEIVKVSNGNSYKVGDITGQGTLGSITGGSGVNMVVRIDTIHPAFSGHNTGTPLTWTILQEGSGYQVGDIISFPHSPGGSGIAQFQVTSVPSLNSTYDSTVGQTASAISNYTIYINNVAQDESWSYVSDPVNNIITLRSGDGVAPNPPVNYTGSVYIQLKQPAINANLGNYEYISIKDIVNNFMMAYVGMDKLIPRVKRSEVIFHAKRGLQEFSYDTLKSINSQELTIPPSLSIPIPQDYVNYVQVSRIDNDGVKRIIYPVNNLTTSPNELPIQDSNGIPTQNSFGSNNEAEQSKTEERWSRNNPNNITGYLDEENTNVYDWAWWKLAFGQRYGLDPQVSQSNGWFQINDRTGTFSFSSELANQLIVLEYISDGLAYDIDSKVPKMAEDALYSHINYSILSTKANTQEFIVQRYKRDRSAKLRNAKIRLSNLKLDEIVQVFRGKSKWLKF